MFNLLSDINTIERYRQATIQRLKKKNDLLMYGNPGAGEPLVPEIPKD